LGWEVAGANAGSFFGSELPVDIIGGAAQLWIVGWHMIMNIPSRALVFGGMGLASILWMLFSLWSGAIYSGRGAVFYRETERFQFYVWIFFYTLLSTLFVGAGIFFFLHPQFSLFPQAHVSDD
jgi:hypothetical protein